MKKLTYLGYKTHNILFQEPNGSWFEVKKINIINGTQLKIVLTYEGMSRNCEEIRVCIYL